ncbi:MAG TPA: EAL domain-containing protein [Solirubrobacteraceae bacterium]|jgi:diguanylate cyclase (GGDEF)-like protein|nr:EAL domain-containing protein [Solirubrobacteraceae bacterium]
MTTPNAGTHSQRGPAEPPSAAHAALPDIPSEHADDLGRLARELTARTDAIVEGMRRRTVDSGVVLDDAVEDSFAQVGRVSTLAVAKWMAGEGVEVARDVGQESWSIFGQLAAQRHAPLNEVTKRCLRWFDAASEVAREAASSLALEPELLARAIAMLQRSLNVTLVRMCESFEAERKRSDDELTFLATHDTLTGLPNRKLILDRAEQLLARSRRHGTPVAAVFIDVDNFKLINDTLGHSCGDELLCAVAARLQGAIRETDTLGRLGGDEFVVLAEELSLAAGPELIAERLLEALSEPFTLSGNVAARLNVTASVGVAVGSRAHAEELLRDADIAMYRAKCHGKNRYVAFEAEMQGAIQSRLELEMDLREALQNEEFFLVYQPIFNLTDMSPTSVEALIRWEHPKRGVVQPEEFIPLLEETGLITEIGGWVLRAACVQGARWRHAGSPIEIAVNVSARQLDDDQFITDVREALSDGELDPHALTIEITETTLMRDAEQTIRRLAAVKALGVRIAIDDFGTGYSSLTHVRRFPVDALKIDRSFITGLRDNQEGEALIHTLVQLGKALSIETVAEGIEMPRELSLLQGERCDSGQGFLFAKPLELAAMDAFLTDWANRAGTDGTLTPAAGAPAELSPAV